MSDLDHRLAKLDHLRAPDLWSDAVDRSARPHAAPRARRPRAAALALGLVIAVGAVGLAARAFLGGEDREGTPVGLPTNEEALERALAMTGGLFDECRPSVDRDTVGVIRPPLDVGWDLEPLDARCRAYLARSRGVVTVDLVIASPLRAPLPARLRENKTRGLTRPAGTPFEMTRWTFAVTEGETRPIVPGPKSGIDLEDSDGLGSTFALPCNRELGEDWCIATGFLRRDGAWHASRRYETGIFGPVDYLVAGIHFFGPSPFVPPPAVATVADGRLHGGTWAVRVYRGREHPGIDFVVNDLRVLATELTDLPRHCARGEVTVYTIPHKPRVTDAGVVYGVVGPDVNQVRVTLGDASFQVPARAVPQEIGSFGVFAVEIADVGDWVAAEPTGC